MPIVEQKGVQEEIVDSALTKIGTSFKDFEDRVNKKFDDNSMFDIAKKVTTRITRNNTSVWKRKLKTLGIDIKGKMSFEGEQDYIKSRIHTNMKLIKSLKDEYLGELELDLSNAYEKGIPAKQLAKSIEKRFGITARRAKLIARNEVKNTTSQLNKKQVEELGFDRAVWLTSIDGRERSTHHKHNKKSYVVGKGLPDGKGGFEEPGDAINCLHPDSIINFAKAKKLTRRRWVGEMITIQDSFCNKITITPNHPILTIVGWKPARLLNKGDKIISSPYGESPTSSNLDVKDTNLSAEEIFNSFGVVGISMGVGTINMNFHGDIANHDVDIISTNCLLGNRINTPAFKGFNERKLPFADFRKGKLLAVSLLNKPRFLGFHSSSSLVSLLTKTLSFFKGRISHPKEHGLGSTPSFNSNISKPSYDDSPSISHYFRDLLYRVAFFKKAFTGKALFMSGEVTEITHSDYDGFVYNLETEDNIYICNGIVNHNCRCTFYIDVEV